MNSITLWFEDPIRTTDLEGLVELAKALDVPLHVGEFLASISDFAEYIHRGAVDVVRLIADNVGGISGIDARGVAGRRLRPGMHAAQLGQRATTWRSTSISSWRCPTPTGLRCRIPAEYADRPYHKDKFRIDKDGYVLAPTAPGLGLSAGSRRAGQNDQADRRMRYTPHAIVCAGSELGGQGRASLARFRVGRDRPKAYPRNLTKDDIDRWMTELSNWGRWGKDDQAGTVNLITNAKRKQAAALVKEGIAISMSLDADIAPKEPAGNRKHRRRATPGNMSCVPPA
jgi:hypothetical protein